MSEEDSLSRPQAPGASGAKAEALQEEIKTLRGDIRALTLEITSIGKDIRALIGVEGKEADRAELKEREKSLKEERVALENQQAKAEDELAGTMRGGEPPQKRLQLAHGSAAGKVGFFNRVLVEHPLDFSRQGVIQLGMGLWGDPDKHQFLVNRHFDVGEELALAFIQKRASVIVAGSKGIGKSCLGLVIVDTLFKKDCIVAYEYSNTQMLLVPSKAALDKFATRAIIDYFAQYSFQMVDKAGLYEFIPEDGGTGLFNKLRASPDLVHVVDLGEQFLGLVEPDHRQIVISSPNSDKLKRFGEIERDAKYVIYPPWTLEDLIDMNSQLVDKKQADNVLKAKYELFGGIPRLIFTNETVDEAMRKIATDVNDVPLETWKTAFCSISYTEIPKHIPGLFVAITESEIPEKKCDVRFASEHIMQLVIRRYAQANRLDLMSLLNAMDGPPRMINSMQGFLLEEVMHGALMSPKPSEYQVLDLQAKARPNGQRKVRFPKLTEIKFSRMDMSDIVGMKKDDYFRPTFTNFKSVESFAIVEKKVLFKGKRGLCIVAFQATVSADHPLKRAGLSDIQERVKQFHGPLDLYVVFVTNQGKGIATRQKLGETEHIHDANYLQCVLYGMELDKALLKAATG
ncbi:hypothetical protein BASA81_007502 [Batrachochytrium salamandrivorans]|nr:hypothetical protein BASA81_007502 [Batrachochytrium salamandrivorans]